VLVHGMTYPLEVWTPLFVHLVARGRRVCRYDLWGRGLSELPDVPLTRPVLVEQLREVVEAAGFAGPVTLVSLSNSDLLVTELARRRPGAVRAVVMVAPSVVDRRTMTFGRRMLGRVPGLNGVLSSALRTRAISRMEGHRSALPPAASPAVREAYAFSLRSARESPVFARAVVSHLAHLPTPAEALETFAHLQRSGLPGAALCFSGEVDVSCEATQLLARHWPGCSVRTLAGTHMGLLEHPEPVNAAVEALV
jgi:pimeloyl-ACP methyl ester carboxylesterase